MESLRFKDSDNEIVEGLGIPFGKDLYGETFSKSTNFALDWYPADRPLLYHHGLDPDVGVDALGHVKSIREIDAGLWIETQLNKRHAYYRAVAKLISMKALGFSSGAPPHLVRKDDAGLITTWPVLEFSLTPAPANPNAKVSSFKSFCDDVGLDLETLKSADAPPPSKKRDDSDLIWKMRNQLEVLGAY